MRSEPGRLVVCAGSGGGTALPASRASCSGEGAGAGAECLAADAPVALCAFAAGVATAIVAAPVAAPLRNARRSTVGRRSSSLLLIANPGTRAAAARIGGKMYRSGTGCATSVEWRDRRAGAGSSDGPVTAPAALPRRRGRLCSSRIACADRNGPVSGASRRRMLSSAYVFDVGLLLDVRVSAGRAAVVGPRADRVTVAGSRAGHAACVPIATVPAVPRPPSGRFDPGGPAARPGTRQRSRPPPTAPTSPSGTTRSPRTLVCITTT